MTNTRLSAPSQHHKHINRFDLGPADSVAQELRDRLIDLDYRAFNQFIGSLLRRLGYTDVAVGRRHWKGRTNRGGRDIDLHLKTGLTTGLIVVQVKQYTQPIQRRFIDELRGTMVRLGARHGLIITTATFPEGAKEAAQRAPIAPIRLIDGAELERLCFDHQLGVRQIAPDSKRSGSAQRLRWEVDEALFERLNLAFPKVRRGRHVWDYSCAARNCACKNRHLCYGTEFSRKRVSVWIQFFSRRHTSRASDDPTLSAIESIRGGDMTWRTHTLAGLSSIWLLALFPLGVTPISIAASAVWAAFGALLPDLDANNSKLRHLKIAGLKPLVPIAQSLNRGLGHRGLLHSLLGFGIISGASLVFIPSLGWQAMAALMLGYASHLAMDAMTRSGIPWLYPSPKRYHLVPPAWRFVTGSHAEASLLPILALSAGMLLLWMLVVTVAGGRL